MQVDLIGRVNNTVLLSQTESQTYSKPTKLITSPYNMGYFGYNESLTTYVKTMSFDKLIADTKKRNQIFFDYSLYLPQKINNQFFNTINEGGENDTL